MRDHTALRMILHTLAPGPHLPWLPWFSNTYPTKFGVSSVVSGWFEQREGGSDDR